MEEFKRIYVTMSVLLVVAFIGSFQTTFGGNSSIGAFCAGASIAIIFSMTLIRIAELKARDSLNVAHLDFHRPATPADNEDEEGDSSDEATDGFMDAVAAMKERVSNIVPFDASTPVIDEESDQVQQETVAVAMSSDSCKCECDCQWKSKGGTADLCGNCLRWWFQQTERCTCDSAHTGQCVCGIVKHHPAPFGSQESMQSAA